MRKKGLTPVIAVILLLMMTVAAAGAAFFWFIRIQSELQGGSEVYTEDLSEKISAKILVIHVDYLELDSTTEYGNATGNLSLYLQNVGSRGISVTSATTNPTTTWILMDSEQDVICATNWGIEDTNCTAGCNNDLEVKETQKVVLTLSNDSCDISGYANNSLFYFKLDFSGIVGTGGTFEK